MCFKCLLQREHYGHLVDKPFFPGLLAHLLSGPVIASVWKGKEAATNIRRLAGSVTDLSKVEPGSIRCFSVIPPVFMLLISTLVFVQWFCRAGRWENRGSLV